MLNALRRKNQAHATLTEAHACASYSETGGEELVTIHHRAPTSQYTAEGPRCEGQGSSLTDGSVIGWDGSKADTNRLMPNLPSSPPFFLLNYRAVPQSRAQWNRSHGATTTTVQFQSKVESSLSSIIFDH
ncbi:hypothetical protein CROQUDRAFT_88892 [Cronartium quercuum f. sp. fusiforme G11]|uniref:Uncharacterized protein n=1 Tax=Cronartium quercuum f. sp. fusiforme G11 TaxID=708437 RepID=A0A9P6NM03_9BASI|nr:hypothetical protein CROQUDRAFT_88892 [Cronartium quercuum f. sp. fusiforme G11]